LASQHYDLIIAGDAPGARMAGIFLARRGRRVLHLHGQGWPGYLLWNSSDLLDGLLERLQARNCLTAAVPTQLHFASSCIEFHGSFPWQEEIRRELPESYADLIPLLATLESWGHLLQENLHGTGGSPSLSIRRKVRWAYRCRCKGLSGGTLSQSFAAWARGKSLPESACQTLAALFGSTSLLPPDKLTVAEAALSWAQLLHPQSVSAPMLDKLLSQRLEDANATRKPLDGLSHIQVSRSGTIECQIGTETLSSEMVLLAAPPSLSLPGGMTPEKKHATPGLWQVETDCAKPARLLAPRLLVQAEEGYFQLALGQNRNQAEIRLRSTTDSQIPMSGSPELTPLFGPQPALHHLQGGGTIEPAEGSWGERPPVKLGKGLYQACAESLYPGLGLLGEALTALTFSGLDRKGREEGLPA